MTTTNNTLVHKYLVPLIENIDFDGCENNSSIKAVISKLMTIAKNTMKNQEEPGNTSGIKIDEMKGALIIDTQVDEKAEPKKKVESKKDTDQSDEHENESSDDSSGSSTKKQHIEAGKVKVEVDDEFIDALITKESNEDSDDEVNTDNIDIILNSDIDDPTSDEE